MKMGLLLRFFTVAVAHAQPNQDICGFQFPPTKKKTTKNKLLDDHKSKSETFCSQYPTYIKEMSDSYLPPRSFQKKRESAWSPKCIIITDDIGKPILSHLYIMHLLYHELGLAFRKLKDTYIDRR